MKKQILLLILTLAGILYSNNLYSSEKIRIAILDLEAKNLSRSTAGTVTDMIITEMVNTGSFEVVERNQMTIILDEQGFQQTGCTDQSCAVEIGKLISARKILIGSVSKMGETFIINIRMVDVETGVVELAAMENAQSESELPDAVRRIVEKISNKAGIRINKKIPSYNESADDGFNISGYYTRGIVPGWGQIYSGNAVKGSLFMTCFILAGGTAVYGYMDFNKKKDEYMNLPAGTTQSVFDKKNDAKMTAGIFALSMVSLTALIYAANWIDLLFINRTPSMEAISWEHEAGDVFFNVGMNRAEQYMDGMDYMISFGMIF